MKMFEPLQELLRERGDQLHEKFNSIENVLRRIASDTRAQMLQNTHVHKIIVGDGSKEASIPNDTGYGWIVHWVALESSDFVTIYRSGVHNSQFLMGLGGWNTEQDSRGSERVYWYIPPGSSIVVADSGEDFGGTLTLQVELIPVASDDITTGKSSEHIDVYNVDRMPDANVLNNEEERVAGE